MKPPCLHKQVTHQCGTNARARLDGCRCDPCLKARRAYDQIYKRRKGEFPTEPETMTDAAPVREHVASLMADGMGAKRIAKVSGVPHGVVSKLMYGDYTRDMPPSRRVRIETADALMSTELDLADGAHVDATEAKEIIEELLARGWWKAAIGQRVHGPKARSLQVATTDLVFAGTLRTLRRLQFEPVPKRYHSPTGRWITPKRDHRPQTVEPSTAGVPLTPDLAHVTRRLWLKEMRKGLAEAVEMARERDRYRGWRAA